MVNLRSSLARFATSGFGPDDAERALAHCRLAWREHGVLLIRADDPDLTWDQRAMLVQIGDRRYGKHRPIPKAPPR